MSRYTATADEVRDLAVALRTIIEAPRSMTRDERDAACSSAAAILDDLERVLRHGE